MNERKYTVEELTKEIRDWFWQEGREGKEALVKIDKLGEQVIESLIKLLGDDSEYIRKKAVKVLGEIGGPRVVEPLIAALSDKDSDVRCEAAEGLGKIRDSRAVRRLETALFVDRYSFVRNSAAEALGKIGNNAAVKSLIKAFNWGWWYGVPEGCRRSIISALKEIGDARVVKPLVKALKDKDSYVRDRAAIGLGKIRDSRAVESLIKRLRDEDGCVQRGAVWALGEIRDSRAIKHLIKLLWDKNLALAASEALGKIGGPAVEPLLAVIKSENETVRERVCEALGEIKDDRAIDPLITVMKDNYSSVRVAAVRAVAMFKNYKIVEPLISVALEDEKRWVQEVAIDCVVKLKPMIMAFMESDSCIREVAELSLQKIEKIIIRAEEQKRIETERKAKQERAEAERRVVEKKKREEQEKKFKEMIEQKKKDEMRTLVAVDVLRILQGENIEDSMNDNQAAITIIHALVTHKLAKSQGVSLYLCRKKSLVPIIKRNEFWAELYGLDLITIDSEIIGKGEFFGRRGMPLSTLNEALTKGSWIGITSYEDFASSLRERISTTFDYFDKQRLEKFINSLNNGMIDIRKLEKYMKG